MKLKPLLAVGLAAVCLGVASPPAWSQDEEKPKFEDVLLRTKDQVMLRATYYAPPEEGDGKTTVPVILVHGWEENRRVFHAMGQYLQSQNHAVIVPDLRGHGRSTKYLGRDGEEYDIDREKMRKKEIEAMAWDIEACKKFLMEKNNKGEVNIELLCVMGSELGGVLAMNWAMADWSVKNLPTYKQGQDVKALILLSPPRSFQGVDVQTPLRHPAIRTRISVMISVGEEGSAYRDARQLYRSLERFRGEDEDKTLIFYPRETNLQGVRLLNARGLNVPQMAARFITERLVKQSDRFPWQDRTNPLNRK